MKYKNKIKIGIIGFNEGNGHPYSFSAIINGYKKIYFKKIGYKNILKYLENKKKRTLEFLMLKLLMLGLKTIIKLWHFRKLVKLNIH